MEHLVIVGVEVLFFAAAVFAMGHLSDLFWGKVFFVASFFAARHDGAEGGDFRDDGGEVELLDLFFDRFRIFVSKRSFGEVWFSVKPSKVDVSSLMFDEVTTVIGSAMLFEQGRAGEVSACSMRGKGVELWVVISKNKENGLGHVQRDET